jgi:pyruvate dehydrogenase E2 component (dihydrolipoamide acetyltransferase)
MPSPKSGVVLKLFGKEGEKVTVGQVLIVIGQPGEIYTGAAPKPAAPPTPVAPVAKPPEAPKPVQPAYAPQPPVSQPHGEITPAAIPVSRHIIATPFVRKLSRELGVDIEMVIGSGEGGRVTEQDVRKAASAPAPQPAMPLAPMPAPSTEAAVKKIPIVIEGEVERIAFRGVRKVVAEHMVTSMKTAMHVTHMDEADVTELADVREKEKANAMLRGIKLTYLAFVVKALVAALKEFPNFNASLDDEKMEMVRKKYYNIGIAVDTEEGLMVPVIKNVQGKTMLDIAKEITELAEKARARKLTLEEMRGGSFTITNIGSVGGVFATPIINYPEVAILGIYKIEDRAIVKNGQVVVRKMLNFSVTFDHRVIDGAEAARFGNAIKKHLEDPGLLMVDE